MTMRVPPRGTTARGSLTQCYVRVSFLAKGESMSAEEVDQSRMTREIHEMPEDVRRALAERGVMAAYRQRPPYQQNDYVGWITRAKLPATRAKRLQQMLDELERGGVYMHMKWRS
jgi:uncharacterized protein YdeI (YjbR/CyaY-like superfamily)